MQKLLLVFPCWHPHSSSCRINREPLRRQLCAGISLPGLRPFRQELVSYRKQQHLRRHLATTESASSPTPSLKTNFQLPRQQICLARCLRRALSRRSEQIGEPFKRSRVDGDEVRDGLTPSPFLTMLVGQRHRRKLGRLFAYD